MAKAIFYKVIGSNLYRLFKSKNIFYMVVYPCEQTEPQLIYTLENNVIYQFDHVPQTKQKKFAFLVEKKLNELENFFTITELYHKRGINHDNLIKELINVLYFQVNKEMLKK